MTTDDALLVDIHWMDEEMETLIGRKVFGHLSHPTPDSTRITFGDGHVCFTVAEAQQYMFSLLATARDNPSKLPWPLNEPVNPSRP